MATTRDIKRKIKSVASTQQITKAMNLVAASKLQRAKGRLSDTRPFFYETHDVVASILNGAETIDHPFITPREIKNSLIIVITGDKGLCGGYNSNIMKEAMREIKNRHKDQVSMIVTGIKGVDYFSGKGIQLANHLTGISDKPSYRDAEKIGRVVFNKYATGEVDEVLLAYTVFNSTISHTPRVERLLPVDVSRFEDEEADGETAGASKPLMEYEPNVDVVLSYIIPKYINTLVYGALVESAACELGARTTAMDSATKNAEERIDAMTILFNRVRQGAITQEITEIIGGANALK